MIEKADIQAIDWEKVLSRYEYTYQTIKPVMGSRTLALLKFFMGLFFIKAVLPPPVDTRFLFFKSMQRKDYDDLFAQIAGQCAYEKLLINEVGYVKGLNVAMLGKWFTYSLPVKYSNRSWGFRFFMRLNYLRCLDILDLMKGYSMQYLVVFSDMQPPDNMLVQYFGSKGVPTSTMQHGLYVDFSGTDNINHVNVANIVSKYFLAWGEETKQLISRFHPEVQVHICGKPVELRRAGEQGDYFTVVLDHDMFREQNVQLLSVAKELATEGERKANIRLHPTNERSNYQLDIDSFVFDHPVEASQFVLGHTTSMMFDVMRSGIPVFKLKSDVPANPIAEKFTFESFDELKEKLKQDIKPADEGAFYIKCAGTESLAHYKAFFATLAGDKK